MKLLVWAIICYVLYRILKGSAGKKEVSAPSQPGKEVYRDPVCGVYVSGDDAIVGNMAGEKLFFCSMSCLEKFREQLDNETQH